MSWFRPGRARLAEPAQRTLLYLMAGPTTGVAVRQTVGDDIGTIAGTLDLPALNATAVSHLLRELATATSPAALDPVVRMRLLRNALLRAGEWVWRPVLAEWPELRGARVELAPIGDVLHLPLHTAEVDGAPVCTVVDLALRVPVHAPAGMPVPLGEPGGWGAAGGRRTCHGIMDADEPWRSTVLLGHRPVSPGAAVADLAGAGEPAAGPGGAGPPVGEVTAPVTTAPVVILVGGRLDDVDALPTLGALWPLPDPAHTADLLAHLHRALVGLPDACTLAEVVAAAHRHGLCIAVWGPFVHFGA